MNKLCTSIIIIVHTRLPLFKLLPVNVKINNLLHLLTFIGTHKLKLRIWRTNRCPSSNVQILCTYVFFMPHHKLPQLKIYLTPPFGKICLSGNKIVSLVIRSGQQSHRNGSILNEVCTNISSILQKKSCEVFFALIRDMKAQLLGTEQWSRRFTRGFLFHKFVLPIRKRRNLVCAEIISLFFQ